jgi:AcrR family transcriptional regulator
MNVHSRAGKAAMRDAEGTRRRIERAALALFVEKGVAGTSIRDIAVAAGIADGALYRHFPSKEALVWHLFAENYLGFAATLEEVQRDAAAAPDRIASMVRGFCTFFDEDWVLFAFLLIVQHRQLAKLPDGAATPVDVVRRVVAEGMRRGEVAPGDPDLVTAMIVGTVLQAATFKIYGRLSGAMSSYADDLAAACRRILGAAAGHQAAAPSPHVGRGLRRERTGSEP